MALSSTWTLSPTSACSSLRLVCTPVAPNAGGAKLPIARTSSQTTSPGRERASILAKGGRSSTLLLVLHPQDPGLLRVSLRILLLNGLRLLECVQHAVVLAQ